jgi:hypothetical protein
MALRAKGDTARECGAWRANAVSRDRRPLRLKRWRAAHVAEDFQAESGRPGNDRAVHPPRIALLQLGGAPKLYRQCGLRERELRRWLRTDCEPLFADEPYLEIHAVDCRVS